MMGAMGWKFIWHVVIERDDETSEHPLQGKLVLLALVGLAVIAIVGVIYIRAVF